MPGGHNLYAERVLHNQDLISHGLNRPYSKYIFSNFYPQSKPDSVELGSIDCDVKHHFTHIMYHIPFH